MADNIHLKLFKMREAVKKEHFTTFEELAAVIDKKAKYHRVLPLYCFYDNVAALTLVNVDDVTDVIKFQMPANNFKEQKQYLYMMAFDINELKEMITPRQYIELTERMKALGVKEKEVLERYNVKSLVDMTVESYKRCMSVMDKLEKKGGV